MNLIEIIQCLVVGLGVGLVSSLLGLGGGILIVPLLPLIASVSSRETIGTSLLTVFLVVAVNVWRFSKIGLVSWPRGLTIGVFAGAGSFTAASATGLVPPYILHGTMALVLALIAVISFQPSVLGKGRLPDSTPSGRLLVNGAIGLGSGLIGGFTGVGGGVLVTPLLARIQSLAPAHVVPTANLSILLTAFFGAVALVRAGWAEGAGGPLGFLRADLAVALFVGAQITASFGRTYQQQLNPRIRDCLVGGLLVVLTLKTLLSAWHAFAAR